MSQKLWPRGLKEFLAREFPGCKNIREAMEKRRLKLQEPQKPKPISKPYKDDDEF